MTTLSFKHLETVIVDIERQMNNHPLTYLESDGGKEQVLTPNVLMRDRTCTRKREQKMMERQLVGKPST